MMEKEASKYYIHMFCMQGQDEKNKKEEGPYITENFEMLIFFANYIKNPKFKKEKTHRETSRYYKPE